MRKRNVAGRRVSAFILTLTMLLSLFPAAAFAGVDQTAGAPTAQTDETQVLVKSGTTEWKYLDDNTDPAGGSPDQKLWTAKDFDDSGWTKTAAGSFGAKNGELAYDDEHTPDNLLTQYIPEGQANAGDDIPGFFFRATFAVSNLETAAQLKGQLDYDDAAKVYINGVAVYETDGSDFSQNMAYVDGSDYFGETFQVTGDELAELNLTATGNVIAVEVHNNRASSSDIYFDLVELTAGPADPTEIRDVILTVGEDESSRSVTWLSTSGLDESLQLIDADKLVEGAFPVDDANVTTLSAARAANTEGDTNFDNYRVTLTGLEENHAYAYRVGSAADLWSPAYSFTTGTKDGAFSFLFAGDPQIGAGGSTDNDYMGWAATLNHAEAAFPEAEFLLSAGDQVNSSGDEYQYYGYTLPTQMKTLTQAVNVGNHDSYSACYSEHYTLPNMDENTATGTGAYGGDYWFAYDGVLVMSINSNDMSTAEHKAFMQKAIADYTTAHGDPTWKLVTFHHSVYSTASHTDDGDILDRRRDLPPVFTELGIDAVLMGHDHVYTRSYMMDGTTPVDDAALYVAEGNNTYAAFENPVEGLVFYLTANSASGSKHYTIQNMEFPFMAVDNQESRANITKVDVAQDSLTFTTYRSDAEITGDSVVDAFTIRRTTGDDTTKPILTVPGDVSFVAGSAEAQAFDKMDGVSARDNRDGALDAGNITVADTLDVNAVGVYTLTYTATDAAGNQATAKRTVTITRAIVTTGLITAQTEWKYLDDNTDPAKAVTGYYTRTVWTAPGVDDSGWKTATGSFGAKRGEIADLGGGCTPTVLLNQYINGTDGDDIPAYFFRTTFDLTDPSSVGQLSGSIKYDDGAIVYINGVRVAAFDDNACNSGGESLGTGFTANLQYGGSNGSDPKTGNFTVAGCLLDALNLKETGNVVAVELHQGRASSSDVYFEFTSLTADDSDKTAYTPAEIKDVVLSVGDNSATRYVTWQSDSFKNETLQLTYAADVADNEFPAVPRFEVASIALPSSDNNGTWNYHVGLGNVFKNGQSYAYRVGSNENGWSDVYYTDSPKNDSDGAFSFLFAGDPQIGSGSTDADVQGWNTTLEQAKTWFADEVEFMISAGDQVNINTSEEQYDGFLNPAWLRSLPLATNVGNHDSDSTYYSEHFGAPGNVDGSTITGTGTYGGDYWFAYDGVLVISLNSNDMSTAKHEAFMKKAIADYTTQYGAPTWKLVTFHHSVYSTAKHTNDGSILSRREELPPIFTKLGIDAVLMGHDHVYTRSYMMNGTTPVDDAALYVADGENTYAAMENPAEGLVLYLTANSASGSKYYAIKQADYPFKAVHNQENTPNITKVDVTQDSLTFTTYRTGANNTADDVVDAFTIRRTPVQTTGVVIDQVYGGGGKGETPIANSFVELYNPGAAPVDLSGYTLAYTDADQGVQTLDLSGAIPAQGSFLVVGKAEATDANYLTYTLPKADQSWDLALNNKAFTLTLKQGADAVDSVSAGADDTYTKTSKQKSMARVDHTDTDQLSDFRIIVWEKAEATVDADFVAANAPRNSKGEMGEPYGATTPPVYTPAVTSDVRVPGFYNATAKLQTELAARYNSGAMNKDGGSMEIVSYNAANGYAYAVNGVKGKLIAVELNRSVSGSTAVTLSGSELDVAALVEGRLTGFTYGDMTSVAVSPDGGKVAVAIQDADYTKAGAVAVFTANADGSLTATVLYKTGVQPDMVVFANADTLLTADEGEPRDGLGEGAVDPAGTVSVIDLTAGTSVQVGFEGYTAQELTAKNILVGVYNGQSIAPALDLEPEYIAVSADGSTAYVSLQEANAVAVLNVGSRTITGIFSVGFQDYGKVAVDLVEDGKYEADTYADLLGARMPDGIALYQSGGKTYLLTANEGDARDWSNKALGTEFANETSKQSFTSDTKGLTTKLKLIDAAACAGLPEGKRVMFGGRSFTLFEVTDSGLTQIYDSGSDFEAITAQQLPDWFNVSNDDVDVDSRSPKKGPEPENVTVGTVSGRTYAFVGLERIGGVMIYDVTDPANATFVNYVNSREFDAEIQGDVSPEGLAFVSASNSKTGSAMLLAANEVSGTLSAYTLTPAASGSSGNNSSGGSNVTTDKTQNSDGSTTTTVTNQSTGTVTATTRKPDGSKVVTVTQTNGSVTQTVTAASGAVSTSSVSASGAGQASVTVPAAAKEGQITVETALGAVTLPAGQQAKVELTVTPAASGDKALAAVKLNVSGADSADVVVRLDLSRLLLTENLPPLSDGAAGPAAITMPGIVAQADGRIIVGAYVSGSELILPGAASGTITILDNTKSFDDVPENHWANPFVTFVAARGLFAGLSDSRFGADAAMTRGMLMTVLASLDGLDTTTGQTWYQVGLDWAVDKGISDGTAPQRSITRQELVTMLYSYAGKPAQSGSLTGYADADSVADYAHSAIVWAVEQGIMAGKDGSRLDPTGSATRAEVAAMLTRFCVG